MSTLLPRILFSRKAIHKIETSLPDAVSPYERPNAIEGTSPLHATALWWDCARFQMGVAQKTSWLILKPSAGDTVCDDGMIEWLVPLDLGESMKPFFTGIDFPSTAVSVCRQLHETLWVILGDYTLVDTGVLSRETMMRYWLRPQSEQGWSSSDSLEYQKLKKLAPAKLKRVLISQPMECAFCGATSDLAIGALNREDDPLIVCRRIVCFDRTTA